MPELPEVETVVRLLRPALRGRRIEGLRVWWERSLGGVRPRDFRRAVVGTRIGRIWRRGKYAVCDLERAGDSAGHLLCHLRMSGRLHVEGASSGRGPHERVRLLLSGGRALRFSDVRKFGHLGFAECASDALASLGPEPLGRSFTGSWLHAALRSRRRALKPLLLDQSFISGLGNIYVDEALHRARLHPLRRSDRIAARSAVRLHGEIIATLREAIAHDGSSFDTFYRTPEGRPGRFQDQFQVYGRQGKPCRSCGTPVRRLVVAQRGTHVCPRCQRAPRAL
ncbi:MAG: bifunctional DNA-formamidopyrimidine glycosylase/DNA-(apurinic or apyrimidinic site) lyase [Planctomycetota bacterium]|jgi:formamidopyrimidine-DNA glycosylase|nr:bifunctional DNA-formamidopyrimidine glycosylase/DNA-(apurinic or apyrimidinic site) lyase [Planctomycetota bacterium]MDP6988821.1 bifunctional DNA-formamidopyrimidine glycosylase/DNA-(apurinic or apyrimidinic site) lyase [Planctomycetota bacterium]